MGTANVPVAAQVVVKPTLFSPQNVRFRQQAFASLTPGVANSPIPLQTGYIIRHMPVQLSFTLQTTGGTSTTAANINMANIINSGAFEAVQNLQVLINGTTPIRALPGSVLAMLQYFQQKQPPMQQWTVTAGGAGNGYNGTAAVEAQLTLPFSLPDALHPIDTALDARLLPANGLSAQVTCGSAANISSQAGIVFSQNPQITFWGYESYPAINGFSPPLAVLIPSYPVPNTAGGATTGAALQLQAQARNLSYKAFLIHAQTPAGVDVDAVTKFRLASGTDSIVDVDPRVWTRQLLAERGNYPLAWAAAPGGEATGVNNPFNIGINQSFGANTNTNLTNPAGWYYIDLAQDGYLTESLNTGSIGSLFCYVDTNAAANVTVYPIQIWGQLM